jgi:hypothetical protein
LPARPLAAIGRRARSSSSGRFDGLYDLATRIVRDRDAGAAIVEDTFVRAWEEL